MRAATAMSTGMSSTHLWDWPGPPWMSVRAPPSNGYACQKDGRHDCTVHSSAVPQVAPSSHSITMPHSQLPPLPPRTRSHESLTAQPHGLSPFFSLLKESKGTTLSKNLFVISFPYFFVPCFDFAECACVCVLYILTLYKAVGCCNGGLGG